MKAARQLRRINLSLLTLSLADTNPDIGPKCDSARQQIIEAIRRLDPESAANPPPEELDVASFHLIAEGAGTLLIDKIQGRGEGGGKN